MKKIQEYREKNTLSVVFLDNSQIPSSPFEPETLPLEDCPSPKFIPLQDV